MPFRPYGLLSEWWDCELLRIHVFLLKCEYGPKGISAHQNDWLSSKRYKNLPERHLGKGNEKEGLTASHQTPLPLSISIQVFERMIHDLSINYLDGLVPKRPPAQNQSDGARG